MKVVVPASWSPKMIVFGGTSKSWWIYGRRVGRTLGLGGFGLKKTMARLLETDRQLWMDSFLNARRRGDLRELVEVD